MLAAAILLAGAVAVSPPLAERIAYAVAAGEAQAKREHLIELSETDTLSPLFMAVAEVVQPAVVEVRVTKQVTMVSPDMEEFMRRFFDQTPGVPPMPQLRPREYFARGLGSGVIVDAENGYVVTNFHVVASADEVQVVLHDGRTLKAEWVRPDPETDLAVVKISADGLVEAPLGDSDQAKAGQWVLAFGSPRGLDQTVTAGIISATAREYGGMSAYQNAIQIDAAINRGNSGGPLVNTRGEVIGINNAIASTSGGNEGIGFAVASNVVRNVMNQLVEHGQVARGYIGVALQDIDPRLAKSFNLPHTEGALVANVQPDTPAAAAGMAAGDFITAIDGRTVRNRAELQRCVAAITPGTEIEIALIRDGKEMTLALTLAPRPDFLAQGETATQPNKPTAADYGLKVQTLTPELAGRLGYEADVKGVVVVDVDPAGGAAQQGVAQGMVITDVQGRAVATAEKFAEALAEADDGAVRIRVLTPAGSHQFVVIEPTP